MPVNQGFFEIINHFDDKKLVKNQQYTFGIFELYKNDLETFMKE